VRKDGLAGARIDALVAERASLEAAHAEAVSGVCICVFVYGCLSGVGCLRVYVSVYIDLFSCMYVWMCVFTPLCVYVYCVGVPCIHSATRVRVFMWLAVLPSCSMEMWCVRVWVYVGVYTVYVSVYMYRVFTWYRVFTCVSVYLCVRLLVCLVYLCVIACVTVCACVCALTPVC
jgi:hypothetical protein